MQSGDKIIEKRMDRLNKWIRDPYNAGLIIILLISFLIRLYHFNLTLNQTLWWDEAEYLAGAKVFAFGIPYDINIQRPFLFQFLASLFLRAGLGEMPIKFVLVLIPSIILVWVTYLLGKELFNKKIGLVAALLVSTSWTLLFWTARMQPDYFSLIFQLLAVMFMWKYWKTNKAYLIVMAGIFTGLGIHFKISGFLIPMIFMVFIFMKDGFPAIKNKDYYIYSLAFILTMAPYMIWSYVNYDTLLGFTHNYEPTAGLGLAFPWVENLVFYYKLAQPLLFVLFALGLVISFKFLLYLDVMIKERKKFFNPEIFSILVLLAGSLFYIFWIRETQDRWVFLWLPFMFFLVGRATMFLYDQIKRYGKNLAIFLILALILTGAYLQYSYATELIVGKRNSYDTVRQAGIWLEQNTDPESLVFSRSHPQVSYYSERRVINTMRPGTTQEDLNQDLDKYQPDYIMVSVFERHADWIDSWISQNSETFTPVQAYFADRERQQPLLIIYEVDYQSS